MTEICHENLNKTIVKSILWKAISYSLSLVTAIWIFKVPSVPGDPRHSVLTGWQMLQPSAECRQAWRCNTNPAQLTARGAVLFY